MRVAVGIMVDVGVMVGEKVVEVSFGVSIADCWLAGEQAVNIGMKNNNNRILFTVSTLVEFSEIIIL